VTTIWPNGSTRQTTYSYDQFSFTATDWGGNIATIPYGIVATQMEGDYGNGSTGGTLSTTAYDYLAFHNPTALNENMLDRPWSVSTTDGITGQQTSTTYGYDETAVVSGNATSGWDSSLASSWVRGNQTSIHHFWDTSNVNLTTTAAYTNTGLVSSITEPANTSISVASTTSYSYGSQYDGALLTGITDALGHPSSFAYNFANGLLASSTDQNDITTSFTYDPDERILSETSPGGSHNLPLNIAYTYPTINTDIKTIIHSSAVQPEVVTTTYDGLGRFIKSDHAGSCG